MQQEGIVCDVPLVQHTPAYSLLRVVLQIHGTGIHIVPTLKMVAFLLCHQVLYSSI